MNYFQVPIYDKELWGMNTPTLLPTYIEITNSSGYLVTFYCVFTVFPTLRVIVEKDRKEVYQLYY